MAKKTTGKAQTDTAQSVSYKLEIDRGVDVIIQFDFTAFDADGNEYDWSLRDFGDVPPVLVDILTKIAKTWPAKDAFTFSYTVLPSGVRQINAIQ